VTRQNFMVASPSRQIHGAGCHFDYVPRDFPGP
jgi:hypothetical protein